MARSRRGNRDMGANIWPGFVDAMGSLLIVLIFLLTVFMIVQSVLRDTINQQDTELVGLSDQVAQLADALGLESARADGLDRDLAASRAMGEDQARRIATLSGELASREDALSAAEARITDFEARVLALATERDEALALGSRLQASVDDLEAAQAREITAREAAQLALAQARSEIDAATEAARLDAARREALEALAADLRAESDGRKVALDAALVDAAAAEALRQRLQGADAELTAMTLALEEQRRKAEETLTLLAAAEAARRDAEGGGEQALSEAQRQAALLAVAQDALADEQQASAAQARQVALLNEQMAALRAQLGSLQGLLATAEAADSDKRIQLDALGTQLNTALAQVAAEQKQRAELEEAERRRLEAEKQNLERFRSEFFGQLRQVLDGREGVKVVGDRFVFSSEVLFNPGSAELAPGGREQIRRVAELLRDAAADFPDSLDWVLRVDGHTDNLPLSGQGEFRDNWQLSQARALSVVRYMQEALGFPPQRLAATGFGEFQPVAEGDSSDARAQNRRIELKLTER